jgi:hypothetical protein
MFGEVFEVVGMITANLAETTNKNTFARGLETPAKTVLGDSRRRRSVQFEHGRNVLLATDKLKSSSNGIMLKTGFTERRYG